MKHLMNNFLFTAVLLFSCLYCVSCSSAQPVHTSTFLSPAGLQGALPPDGRIGVVLNEQVPNPIFDKTVKDKLEKSLLRLGYVPVEPAQASHHLRYAYDLQGETNPMRRSLFTFPGAQAFYVTGSNNYDSYFGGGLGFGTFVNDPRTVYMAKLRLKLSRPLPGIAGQEEVLWVGEAAAQSDKPELRKMMDFLVAALFRYFMQDTLETKTIKLSGEDIDVRALTEEFSAGTAAA